MATRAAAATLSSLLLLSTSGSLCAQRAQKVKRPETARDASQPAGKGKPRQPGPGPEKVVRLPAPSAVQAVNITATKTDNIAQTTQKLPGDTITYTVTISNTSSTDNATGVVFNDVIDPNTTLVPGSIQSQPIAGNDTYNVIGNVRIQPTAAQGVRSNDADPDGDALTVTGPNAGPSSGQLTLNSDGSFTYNPNPGYTGTDSFTYTVTDTTGKTDTATVTFKVGDGAGGTTGPAIWFVDDSAAAGGDGRLTAPFNCYTGTNVPGASNCFSASSADDAGDVIFLYEGSYTGGNTLLNTQKLVGQGATDTLATVAGVTVPAYSDPLPPTKADNGSLASPALTTLNAVAVPLAQGNTLRGFTVSNTGMAAKISGTNFGTLTVGKAGAPDVSLSGMGQALSLTTGTLSVAGAFASVATTSSAAQGIALASVADSDGAGGTAFSFGSTSVSGSTTQGILVGTTTADINFGNTSVTGGTDALSLQNNSSGMRTFGTISTSGNSAAGFLHGAGGGAVNVTGATTITNPGGNGVDIDSSNANLSFAATTVNKNSTGGVGVDLTSNASRTIGFSSLAVTTTTGVALNANNSGTVYAGGGSLTQSGAGGGAATLTGTALSLTLTSVSSNGGVNGLAFTGGSGSFTSGTTNLQNNTAVGLSMASSAVAANFGNTTVNSTGGDAVDLSSNTGNITFADLDLTPDSGLRGLDAQNNTGTITATSGDVSTTNAPAVFVDGPAGLTPLNVVLTSSSANVSAATAANGVSVGDASGTLTLGGGVILGGNAAAFAVTGGTANITYAGTVTQSNAQRAVNVDATAGGTVSFTDTTTAVTGGAASTGVNVNNANGNVSFAELNLGTGAARMTNTAVTIAGGAGTKSLGAVSIFTTGTALGINATGSTGAISVASGEVNSAGATAVNIAGVSNVSKTPLNVQFTSISANGGAKGITVSNTSATGSPGGFRVNGTGSTDGSGGTIQNTDARGAEFLTVDSLLIKNMNFTNANDATDGGAASACDDLTITSCNAAVYLSGITTLSTFDNVNITGTMVENGMNIIGAANFKFDNSTISGCGNEGNEHCIKAQNVGGTATVTNSTLSNSAGDLLSVHNNDTPVSLTVSGSTFNDTRTKNGDSGILFRNWSRAGFAGSVSATGGATPLATINILNNTFTNIQTQSIQVFSSDDSVIHLDVVGNNIDCGSNATDVGTGLDLNAAIASTFEFNVLNNPHIKSRGGAAVNITSFEGGHIEGRVNNNPDIQVQSGAGIPVRMVAQEQSALIVEVDNNTVSNVGGTEDTAVDVQSRFQTARADVTVTRNQITGEPTGVAGINLIAGSSAAGESNITCGDIGGGVGFGNNVTNAAGNTLRAFRVRNSDVSNTNRIYLEGYNTSVENTWNTRSNLPTSAANSEVAVSLTGTAVAPSAPPGGVCAAVDAPADFPVGPPAPDVVVEPPAAAPDFQGVTSQPSVIVPQPEPVAAEAPAAQPLTTPEAGQADASQQPGVAAFKPGKTAGDSGVIKEMPKKGENAHPAERAEVSKSSPVAPQVAAFPVVIGNLPANDSVTITFSVTINPSFTGASVSNQGQVTGTNFTTVNGTTPTSGPDTDDPDAAGTNNPTVTQVAPPPDIAIKDASAAEPASGSSPMSFTVVLSNSHPSTTVTVNYTTADGGANPATGGSCGTAGVDYETTTGTLSFAPGQTVQSVSVPVCADADASETPETFFVNLTGATGGNITDNQAVGTINPTNTPGTLLISELRTSGPGAGAAGEANEFVELYNNTDAPVDISGYGLFKSGSSCTDMPVLVATVPPGTTVPARSHYLFVGSGYSLADYGGTGNGAGDQTLASDIETDRNVGFFSTTLVANLSSSTRRDAVGFASNAGNNCDLLREGTPLPAASGAGSDSEYSFLRKLETGRPADTNDNAADFAVVTTTPAGSGTGGAPVGSNSSTRFGAPGPERSNSPVNRTATVKPSFIDATLPNSSAPNRVRDTNAYADALSGTGSYPLGTLSIRRRFTNSTGSTVTRLRVRLVDVTTGPAPSGTADLRAVTSQAVVLTNVQDPATCAASGSPTTPCDVTAQGTTLEQPPTQTGGGGYNSTLALPAPLANGASVSVQFLLGVRQGGSFRFLVIVEALP